VVDDDTMIRAGLQVSLTGVDVVATYPDISSLLRDQLDVDVVLLDLGLSGTGRTGVLQGAAGVRAVAESGFRILIYTNERRREVLVGCFSSGASGIVHKAEPSEAVVDAISKVAAGEVVITQALVGLAELAEHRDMLPSLSARQRQILSARARGESFQSICTRLFIAKKTAEEHWAVVAAKFAEFLREHSPADLERHLGLTAGDLLEWTQ
jgi:DNA-binding NarL/FixJ family response regulator